MIARTGRRGSQLRGLVSGAALLFLSVLAVGMLRRRRASEPGRRARRARSPAADVALADRNERYAG